MKKLLFILIGFASFNLLAQIPAQKLAAFFPFNNNAIDSSGNGNHGKVFGATLTKDRFGNPNSAYYFDGNDYIFVKDDKSLRLKSLSYSGWYNFENTWGLQLLLDKHVGTSYLDSYEMWLESERLVATIGNNNQFGTFIEAPQQLKSGKWYFFAYTFDNTSGIQKLYIDGILAKQNNANTTIFCDDEPLLLGASHDNTSPSYYFKGTMDDVRIYNDALTDKEIKSLFETKKDTIVIPPKKDTIVIPPKKDTIVVVVPKKDTISITPLIVGIYPNPTEADLTIKSNIIIKKINIYNCLGQLLISREVNKKLHTLDVSDFPPAGYFIEIITVSEERKSYKFIKI